MSGGGEGDAQLLGSKSIYFAHLHMKTDPETKELILEVVDRFLTTWRPTVASTIRTRIWDKSTVLAELAKDGVLLRLEDDANEPCYFPRLLAFELLGDSKRFAFALKRADRWLQQLRQLAIERDSLQVELLDFDNAPAWPPDADPSMLHLLSDFSNFVESINFVEYRFGKGPTFSIKKIPRINLRPSIRNFTDITKAWADELSARGMNPVAKVSKDPLTRAEVNREVSRRSGVESEPDKPPSRILTTPKFAFVHDSAIKAIVERDYNELVKIRETALKARFILSGGIIEGLLLDALLQDVPKAMNTSHGRRERRPLEEWGLSALLDTAVESKLISSSAQSFGHSVREYRNLVHPGLEYRSGLTLASEEVEIAERVMDIVIRDLSS
jgi:hypothetical protein